MNELLKKIKLCKTMPELDALRLEIVTVGAAEKDAFIPLQNAFKSKKNQLNSTPLVDRGW